MAGDLCLNLSPPLYSKKAELEDVVGGCGRQAGVGRRGGGHGQTWTTWSPAVVPAATCAVEAEDVAVAAIAQGRLLLPAASECTWPGGGK